MIKIKKNGFTLSEMLITLSVVGLLGVLVLPGLIKDTTSKASITLLQSTVSSINDAVQNEIVKTRTTNLDDTDIKKDPEKFFKDKFETISTSSDGTNFPTKYKNLNNTEKPTPNCSASAILKNGVSICSHKNTADRIIYIDINGNNSPNIIGVDLFAVIIADKNTDTQHIGDVGGPYLSSDANIKSNCQNGNVERGAVYCYYLLEASGFDHNYLNK